MARIGFESGIALSIASPGQRTTKDLTSAQLRLVRIMNEYQFGRIEQFEIREGQPLVLPVTKVVRVAHLGGGESGTRVPNGEEFELKQVVWDLFAELGRLHNCTVVRLEFKRGLPCLLETTRSIAD